MRAPLKNPIFISLSRAKEIEFQKCARAAATKKNEPGKEEETRWFEKSTTKVRERTRTPPPPPPNEVRRPKNPPLAGELSAMIFLKSDEIFLCEKRLCVKAH